MDDAISKYMEVHPALALVALIAILGFVYLQQRLWWK